MDEKKFVSERVDYIASDMIFLRDRLFNLAELPYREFRSSDLLIKVLRQYGFQVTEKAAGIPTCFFGRFSSGEGGMTVGLLGEFDALDGLSQKAGCTVFSPVRPNAPGHGCGHCCLGIGSLAAAIALKEYLVESGRPGTVIYYGCPAEEGAGSKQFMAREGLFDCCDFVYTWHPDSRNMVDVSHCNAIMGANFYFRGRSAHAGATPYLGRSALDAAELMSVGCNYLREHMIPEARVHYAYIDSGGTAPNVVQDRAVVRYEVRAPYVEQVKELYGRVQNVARGAAMMTETSVTAELAMAFTEYIPNLTLSPLVSAAMAEIGAPEWDEEDYAMAAAYLESFPEDSKEAIRERFRKDYGEDWEKVWARPLDASVKAFDAADITLQAGSTDVGDVGCAVPCVNLLVATACLGNVGHTWQMTGQAGSRLGAKGTLTAAKMLALAAIRTMDAPETVAKAREEVLERNGGKYCCPLPDEVRPPIDTY